MKNAIRGACAVALTTQLVGCAGMYYQPSASSPRAAIRLENKSELGPVQMVVYDNPQCIGGKFIGASGVPKGQSRDIAVEAGAPLTFAVTGDRGTTITTTRSQGSGAMPVISDIAVRNCQTYNRFTPLPGASYKITFTDDGAACAIGLVEVAVQSERALPFERLAYGRQSEKDLRLSCAP